MTEKRFKISQGYSDTFCHDWERNKLLNFRQIVDLLNNFVEENEELKSENKELKTLNKILKNELSWIKDCAYWKEKEAFDKLFGNYMKTVDEYRIMTKENQYLKELLMYCCEVDECEIEDELERRKSE